MEPKFTRCEITLGASARKLAPPQKMLVLFLSLGLSTKEIASRTGRSPNTVKRHTAALFAAFGVNSRGAVIAQAFCHHVLVPANRTGAKHEH